MESKVSYRVCLERECVHAAPPEEVFPLLCPVREYEWIERWDCTVVYSESGVAEEGCIFETDFAGRETWVVTRYEPPQRIEFCIFVEAGFVEQLIITVRPEGASFSRVHWRRIYTALSADGEKAIRRHVEPVTPARMQELDRELAHYLATGSMWRHESADAV